MALVVASQELQGTISWLFAGTSCILTSNPPLLAHINTRHLPYSSFSNTASLFPYNSPGASEFTGQLSKYHFIYSDKRPKATREPINNDFKDMWMWSATNVNRQFRNCCQPPVLHRAGPSSSLPLQSLETHRPGLGVDPAVPMLASSGSAGDLFSSARALTSAFLPYLHLLPNICLKSFRGTEGQGCSLAENIRKIPLSLSQSLGISKGTISKLSLLTSSST